MKRYSILSLTIITPLIVAFSIFAPSPAGANGQERSRELKVRVGVKTDENAVLGAKEVRLWALIIGISQYQYGDQDVDGGRIPNLKNAATDAQAIYDFLRSREGGEFPENQMFLLKDEKATKAAVEEKLNRLVKETRPEDYFIIYIAGHGTIMPTRNTLTGESKETPYFVLYDTTLGDLAKTGLEMSALPQYVGKIPAKKGLVLSDTCHSGGVLMANTRDTPDVTTTRFNTEYLKRLEGLPEGVGFISAAGATEKAAEKDELEGGVFTFCLLDALRGLANENDDEVVTYEEVVKYLRQEVPKLTNQRQNPYDRQTSTAVSRLALSVVNYVGKTNGSSAGGRAQFGTLVIRTPDIDNVNVSIDGKPIGEFKKGMQRTVNWPAGRPTLSFTRASLTRKVEVEVEPGRSKPVEVNLTFSEGDEDDWIGPTKQQVTVYLREEKEPSEEAKKELQRGVEEFNKQRFDAAVKLFNSALQKSGNQYAEAWVYLGRAQQSLEQNTQAIKSFNEALALRPSDFQTSTLLAEAMIDAGFSSEAARKLRDIIRSHPNYGHARVVYGDYLFMQNNFRSAEGELKQAIRINPNSPPAHMILADVLSHAETKEKREAAVREARTAKELFERVSEKQHSASRSLQRLSISHLIFGGGRYVNKAAMAEAHHTIAKAIVRLVEDDATYPNRDALLKEARASIQESMKLAGPTRMALALETSAQIHYLSGDVKTAIKDGELSLKTGQSISRLEGRAELHRFLSAAYESDNQFWKASDQLKRFMAKAGPRLPAKERQSYEEDIKRLERQAEVNGQKK